MAKRDTIIDLADHLAGRRTLLRLVQDRAAAAALRAEIKVIESRIAAKLEAAEPVVNFAAYKRLIRAR